MQNATQITEEFINAAAQGSDALASAKQISSSGGFEKLYITEDQTLIFGECKGSGTNPYSTSADFSADSPVFRCSCPSRQIPCKHALALMLDYLAKKSFVTADVPEDIRLKREKQSKKAAKAAANGTKPAKQNTAAAAKKLEIQREGLNLAESIVNDILLHGASSVTKASAERYLELAKQLGDSYLPEPQKLIYEIIEAANRYTESGQGGEEALRALIHKCVRLSSTVKKCRDYIDRKLANGEVLPEDSILYEAMGGVWKLTQLKELGLYKDNARIIQLSFTVINEELRKELVDTGFWLDLDSGEIYKTETIRPAKASKRIKAADSEFGVYTVETLCLYPGGTNRRVRWETAVNSPADETICKTIISKAEPTAADAVKKAKNELKNTLADPYIMLLLPFDSIAYTPEKSPVLMHGDERVLLTPHIHYPDAADSLRLVAGNLHNGALLCALSYNGTAGTIEVSPVSAVTEAGIIRL